MKQIKNLIISLYLVDINSWDKETAKPSQQMKASSFANEDPAPFNPTLISSMLLHK